MRSLKLKEDSCDFWKNMHRRKSTEFSRRTEIQRTAKSSAEKRKEKSKSGVWKVTGLRLKEFSRWIICIVRVKRGESLPIRVEVFWLGLPFCSPAVIQSIVRRRRRGNIWPLIMSIGIPSIIPAGQLKITRRSRNGNRRKSIISGERRQRNLLWPIPP